MKSLKKNHAIGLLIFFTILVASFILMNKTVGTVAYSKDDESEKKEEKKDKKEKFTDSIKLDTEDYDKRMLALSHYTPPVPVSTLTTSTDADGNVVESYATTTPPSPLVFSENFNVSIKDKLWPRAQPYPLPGAVLPFKRIISYYGNFYSTRMGILGELEPDQVLARLAQEKAAWEAADPNTPVLQAIEYIAMVAQADAGADGMYRAMMPDEEIEKAYAMAQKIDGVMILDIQIGLSPLTKELPKFKKYLERPDVFFALDPEFSMKSGDKPGDVIGTFNADDINYTINYMSEIVKENNLPPKVLLVHRFTQKMMTGYDQIKATPEVQVVVVMDGWGSKDLKRGTYKAIIEPEPVQFAGIKVFYKNDLKSPSTGIFSPQEILALNPKPIFVQYQ